MHRARETIAVSVGEPSRKAMRFASGVCGIVIQRINGERFPQNSDGRIEGSQSDCLHAVDLCTGCLERDDDPLSFF